MTVSSRIILAVILVFISCGANVVFLEHLTKFSLGCGELVTFIQFLSISIYGFITVSKFGTKQPVVPIRQYILAVILFYGSSITGNMALGCHISMPIQMLFKSGSVLASLTLGVLLLKRSYPLSKYISVAMISIGIAMCLLISTDNKNSDGKDNGDFLTWLWGIFLLISSLFMGARLGVAQEQISQQYGRHPEELLFYSNVLALPGFLLFYQKISTQISMFAQGDTILLPYISIDVPLVWLYLIANILTQFVCINSVYVLATEMSSLALTVILTIRKFSSLIISIFYFNNPFTVYHWFGTGLVFTGTLLFSGVLQNLFSMVFTKTGSKKKDE